MTTMLGRPTLITHRGSDSTTVPMRCDSEIHKIAFIGNYLPRKCGIATFTHDMHQSITAAYPGVDCFVLPVNDRPEGYDYPPEVRFEFPTEDLEAYRRAADFLNFGNTDIVSLQHEYGIFGGTAGSHILGLLRDLRMPVVTTLHTVLKDPDADQRRVMRELCDVSARVVVMTERGRTFLREIYRVPESKIDLIAHGIPDVPFVDPNFHKDKFGVEGRLVALTFGLLAPNKGIEHMLHAIPRIAARFPQFIYVVLGATHPHLLREVGEEYRLGLERLIRRLGVEEHVAFHNRFVDLPELTEFLGVADAYVTPYLNPAQITSGTLAYAFGCGKAVVSTPYWHAEELLADDRGILVPFGNSEALADAIIGLFSDETRRHSMRRNAYMVGREMIWSESARHYMESFLQARRARADGRRRPVSVRTVAERDADLPLPDWRFDHLLRMTDGTGIFQHASFTIPNFAEGYCSDDNARALLAVVMLEECGQDWPALQRAASTYAAFLQAAFNPGPGRFRNFLSFDRRWLEEIGSEDAHGRCLWAVGACVGRSRKRGLQYWAAPVFDQALPSILETTSPRAWAFAILGMHEYLSRLSGDRRVGQIRDQLVERLMELRRAHASEDWLWFEPILSYDNARLPQALILAGHATGNSEVLEAGLASLRWLSAQHLAPGGHFRPVGSDGFWRRGQDRAQFDQQPLEACAAVGACLDAFRATADRQWLADAWRAFEWFSGRNDLQLPVYDPSTGGCRDGLHQDRVNQNQGAESTLSFLLALAEMSLIENALAAFRQLAEAAPAEPTDRAPQPVS